ncbi:MAG: hypothetical protein HKN78_04670 [Sphingomonadaceae bacterium]|nr:hypothetical protein [Sphingomonadaceae bacterium]
MLLAANIVLSLAMVAVFALGVGGIWLWRRKDDRHKGLLMLAAAGVILANVLIWSLPPPAG